MFSIVAAPVRQIGAPDSGPSIRAPPSPPLDTHGWLGFVAAADPIVARRLPIARYLHSPVLGFVEGERGRTQEGERREGERTREGEGKSTGDRWMRLQPFASPFSSCLGGHFGPIQTYKCCKWDQEGFIRKKGQSSRRARI